MALPPPWIAVAHALVAAGVTGDYDIASNEDAQRVLEALEADGFRVVRAAAVDPTYREPQGVRLPPAHTFTRADEPNPDHAPCEHHASRGQTCRCRDTLITIRCSCQVEPVADRVDSWPRASELMSAHVADDAVPVHTSATEYALSVFPRDTLNDARNARMFTVHVRWRGFLPDGGHAYAVFHGERECWNDTTRRFEFESSPSNREDDFVAQTRYSRERALELARELAPRLSVMHLTAPAALALRRGTGVEF